MALSPRVATVGAMDAHRGKLEQEGVLAGHYRVGKKRYEPRLVALGTTESDWVRSDAPDLLWPMAVMARGGDAGLRKFAEWQRRAVDALGDRAATVQLDGRLTSLEALDSSARSALNPITKDLKELDLLPDELLSAFRLYKDVPGAWLLVDPWSPEADEDAALSFLAEVLTTCIIDGHAEAMVKFVLIGWGVLTRTFSASSETIDLLKTYPGDPAKVGAADSVVRASFSAMRAAETHRDPEIQERRDEWAKRFWASNWRLSPCLLSEEIDMNHTDLAPTGDEETVTDATREFVASAVNEYNRFLQALADAEVDLFDPAKHEVIGGLTTRAARAVAAILRSPHMWCGEHGSGVIRILAETEIVLSWLALHAPEGYSEYQAFGRGKAKLMKAHMAELAESFEGEPPERLQDALNNLDKKLGGEWGEEFIPVSVESTFAGKSMRALALGAGLDGLYRNVYQNASGVQHGEWWALEDYALQRCLNPLHRFHWIPSAEPVGGEDPEVGEYFVSRLQHIVSLAVAHLCG